MPSKLDDQLSGKFKNVPFFVRDEVLNNVGQTRVIHKYPKSSIQYAESMGEEPFNETISLFFSGPNYKADFQKFKKAIQNPSPGRLFSPEFGIFNSIVALPASFKSNQNTIGEISASVNFLETISKPSPVETNITEQDVAERAQSARDELLSSFSDSYIAPSIINNVLTAKSDAVGLSEKMGKILNNTNNANDFLRKVDRALRNPSQYASLLLNAGQPIGYLQAIALTAKDGFNTFKSIASMGSTLTNSMNDILANITPTPSTVIEQTYDNTRIDFSINIWEYDTAERIRRNNSRLSIVNTFRIVGIIGMFEKAASKSYTTTDQIETDTLILDQYYTELIEDDETNVIIPNLKPILDELKNLTYEILNLKKQQAYTVIEMDILRPTSSYLLAYQLYGEYLRNEAQHEFIASLLAGLNRSLPRNRLQGVVRVVEIGR